MVRTIEAKHRLDIALAHLNYAHSLYSDTWAGPDEEHLLSKRLALQAAVRSVETAISEVQAPQKPPQ